ncbi:MAG TPA: CAP domain-containing protein [Candidatus Paceibacterota bacterium]|nr:CAP domain-containing protein [Candidatus Paceibacterota bacterium]
MYKKIVNILFFVIIGTLIVFMLVKPRVGSGVSQHVLHALAQKNPITELSSSNDTSTSSILSYLDAVELADGLQSPHQETAVAITTDGIVDATNQERINAGLPPLKLNNLLVTSATQKTMDMIAKQYFDHTSPTGVTVSDLGKEVGYDYIVMGENLALGDFTDANDVVAAWMQSPGHRANILNPAYQEIGAYAAKGMYQGKEVWFVVQHFGTPRAVCPLLDSKLKASIDAINTSLKNLQGRIASDKATLESPNHPEGAAYEAMVNNFNNLVVQYNTSLVISQEETKQYNAQVVAFNNCLTHYQPASS